MWNDIRPEDYEEAVYGNPLLISVFNSELEWLDRVITPSSVLIEVGCGTGKFCLSYLHRVNLIIGVDLSASALEFLRAKCPLNQESLMLIHGDAVHLRNLLENSLQLSHEVSRRHRVNACVMNTLGIMPRGIRATVLREMMMLSGPQDVIFVVVFNRDYFAQGVREFYFCSPKLCGEINDSDINWEEAEVTVASSGYYSHWFSEEEVWELLHEAGAKNYTVERVGMALFVVGRGMPNQE